MEVDSITSSSEEFDILINKFKEQEKIHPNISRFWITYLENKKKIFIDLFAHSEYVLSKLQASNDVKDIEMKDLINMMLVKMIIH